MFRRAEAAGAAVPRGQELLALAVSIGLMAGLLEVAVIAVRKFALGQYMHLNPQIVWLAPVCYALLFAGLAAAVLLVSRGRPGTWLVMPFLAVAAGVSGVLFLALPTVHKGALMVLAAGAAAQLTRVISSRPGLARWIGRGALPWLAGTVALLAVVPNAARALGERRADATLPAAPAGAPNILFIIWDTVRAASLSVYGYERPTTPTLEQLAGRGVVFERAVTPAPWTLPSHAAMFTGLPAHRLAADWLTPLEREPATLAEVLRRHGYRTGGFVANLFYCSRESGLARGFDVYRDYPLFSVMDLLRSASIVRAAAAADAGVVRRVLGRIRVTGGTRVRENVATQAEEPAAAPEGAASPSRRTTLRQQLRLLQDAGRKDAVVINEQFLEWLGPNPDRPFFAFLNYFDAHAPYLPPAPFDTAFGPRLEGRNPINWTAGSLSPRELQAEIDAYDGTIAYLDFQLAQLLGRLDEMGLLDNTIVVVTSDHGEEFGEHGVFTHGNSLYQQALHVPLIIAAPGRMPAGQREASWVSVIDVGATLLDLAGLTGAAFSGRSLALPMNAADNGAGAVIDTLRARVSFSWTKPDHYPVSKGDMEAVFAEPYKYIRRGDGSEELYDLIEDAGETRNLAGTGAADPVLVRLRAQLGPALGDGLIGRGATRNQ